MQRRIDNVAVTRPPYNHQRRGAWRLARPLSLAVLFSSIVKAFTHRSRIQFTSPSTSAKDKRKIMRTTIPAPSVASIVGGGGLNTTVTENKPETVTEVKGNDATADVRAPEQEVKEIFEKRVSALSGFAKPLNTFRY